MITQNRLKEVVVYDPITGVFTSKAVRNRHKIGDVFNTTNSCGYLRIKIDYTYYYLHRLVWLYMHGVWPSSNIDHINGDKADNRFTNLREATQSQNCRNRPVSHLSATKVKGVDFCKPMGRYRARIRVDGKRLPLGYFDTIEEAAEAYKVAAQNLHEQFAHHVSRSM